jgi:hypothetical protein
MKLSSESRAASCGQTDMTQLTVVLSQFRAGGQRAMETISWFYILVNWSCRLQLLLIYLTKLFQIPKHRVEWEHEHE